MLQPRSDRDAILATAMEMIRLRGYADFDLDRLSAVCGVGMYELEEMFPRGKTAIVQESLVASASAYVALVALTFDRFTQLSAAVREFFQCAKTDLEDSGYANLCPIADVANELGPASTVVTMETTAEASKTWVGGVSDYLERRGVSAPDAWLVAVSVVSAYEGVITVARGRRNADVVSEVGNIIAERFGSIVMEPIRA